MRCELLPIATRLVRAWTRVYTHGLPRAERSARRAEIDSDLWEFEHDPEAPQGGWAATQVLARLFVGIPDDLAWCMEVGANAHRAPVRALAAAGMMTGPRRVSAFGLAATIHVVAIPAVVWLVSLGPVPSPNAGKAAPGRAGIEHRLPPNASLWNQRVTYERHNGLVTKMPKQSVATPGKARAFGMVSAAVVAVAARLGLIAPPRPAADTRSSASGLSPANNESVTKIPVQSVATPGKARAFDMVSAAVVAVAARVGLIATPRPAAQGPSQPDRFVAKVLENRYSLSVRNGQLSGTGAQVLQSAIAESHFVLLGEDHGLAQTPELGAAICNAAGPERFQAMAIEEGPVAAAELHSLARRQDGLAQLAASEKAFPKSINVYNAREEFEMLQQCARAAQGEFHLWGLNQEGLNAGGLILSRILESRLGEPARLAMRQLFQKNEDAYRKALQSGRIEDLFMLSADDQDLAHGAASLQRDGSPEARSLFASLVESHEINRVPPADYDNARRREHLMKTRFAADYTRAARTAATPPRVLLRFGAYHIYRGLNPVRGRGIGNYVAEFAEGRGAQSLHIRLMPVKGSSPFYPRVGQPAQLRPFNYDDDPRSQYLRPMLGNRLNSDWTMFDLRPLRHDFNALAGATNPDLATLVFGIDILVVVPEGTPSTEIH
jgi:hypothetical protein